MRFEDQRKLLVKELSELGISSKTVLEAFLKIPRENFIEPYLQAFSYKNGALPIAAGQTISQPIIVAYMLQALDIEENDLVLEIGTGSGYQTALISLLAKSVCTIERHRELLDKARKTLHNLNITNAYFYCGDGTLGWKNSFPLIKEFDKIIVSAGAPCVPDNLLKQLKDGGKMIIPVGDRDKQILKIIVRNNDNYDVIESSNCNFVPLIGDDGWKNS